MPTSTTPRRPRALPSSTPPTRSWARTTSAGPSIAARSTPRASRVSRASKASARARGPGAGFGQDGIFETFSFGPDGFQRAGGRAGGGFRGFGGFEDILKEAFGGAARGGRPGGGGVQFEQEDLGGTGQDVTAALTITLAEAAKGTSKRVQLPTGKEVEVKIPAGLTDGQPIRLKGQGLAGPRGRTGDLLIAVRVAPHPLFTREGADLRLELPITLYEAVLGGKVRVPTLDGAVELAIPAGTSSGRTFRLKGKGLTAKDGNGDLLATVRIMLPERGDAELDELMRAARDETVRSEEGYGVSPSARTRSSRTPCGNCDRELRVQRGTRIIELRAVLDTPKFVSERAASADELRNWTTSAGACRSVTVPPVHARLTATPAARPCRSARRRLERP